MWIIEGSYKKTKFQSKTHFSLSSKAYEPQLISYSWERSMGDVPLTIILKNNLVSVDIVADEKATGGGVQGAAGGAVLGFLIAGPLGTAVGARIGSKKSGQDNTTLIITTDHGRGGYLNDRWGDHGQEVKGAEFVWSAIIGPDTPSIGELSNVDTIYIL